MRSLCLAGILLVGCGVARAAPVRTALPATVPGHLIVSFRRLPSHLPGSARIVRKLAGRMHLVEHDPADTLVAARLAADPDVEWVEPERIRFASAIVTANDPLFKQQWGLQMARLPAAWSRTEGSQRVVVAVLDSGIRPHPDLQPRYLGGYDFITDDNNAADGQPGRDPDPTDAGTSDPTSSALHGMHVAGIIGAHTDNQVGIAGVDWNCRILPVRVLGVNDGQGTDVDISDAIRWAAGVHVDGVPDNPNPADVINLSFGGPGGSAIMQAAIDDAVRLGVIVVAAAGNDGADTSTYAPAGLDHVIAVGAVDDQAMLAWYSNRGPRVDLVAPGGDLTNGQGIISTLYDEADGYDYQAYNGTSQAAPHVTGVAALMKALDPTIDDEHARLILRNTADPSKQCAEGCGGGLLDADAAIAAVSVSCQDGHCAAALGTDVVGGLFGGGGCALGGRPAPAGAALLVVAALALLVRRRRRD